MKMIVVVALALVAAATAAPPAEVETIKILRSDFEKHPDGAYQFGFETENGIQRQENGQTKEVIDEDKKPQTVVVVRGSYSYPDKDGNIETVNYEADENGYRAEGNSIPKLPAARR